MLSVCVCVCASVSYGVTAGILQKRVLYMCTCGWVSFGVFCTMHGYTSKVLVLY